jgi:hypothetical protein
MKAELLNSLPTEVRISGVLNFQRFVLEQRDIGLDEYLKERLENEELSYWNSHK